MGAIAGQSNNIVDKSAFIPLPQRGLAAVVVVTERGPIGEYRRVSSWEEFGRTYGGFLGGRVEAHCVKRALDAGCHLLVSRTVHFSDVTDPTTKTSAAALVNVPDRSTTPGHGRSTGTATFPLRLTHASTLVVAIDGGSNQTATFNGYAARFTGTGATFAAVTASHVLVLVVKGVQRTVTFTGSENSLATFRNAIDTQCPGIYTEDSGGQLRVTTDQKGSGATLTVHASSSADVLTSLGLASGDGAPIGSSNVVDLDAVTAAEFETIVEGAVTGCSAGADGSNNPYVESTSTGVGSTVLIHSSSTLDTVLGFDNSSHAGAATSSVNTLRLTAASDGTWAHAISAVIDTSPVDPTNRFRVRIYASTGRLLETHDGLAMSSGDARYVVNVLRNESQYLRATDLASATAAPNNQPLAGTYTPSGGNNGLTSLADTDFTGGSSSAGRTGLRVFDTTNGFRLVAMPGITGQDAVANAIAWCAARKDCAFVGSVPSSITSKQAAIAWRRREAPYATGTAHDSCFGALYAGWHYVTDPVTGAELLIPIDGELLATHARCCKVSGPWYPHAGPELGVLSAADVRRLAFDISDAEVLEMRAAGVNPVQKTEKFGYVILGETTLQRTESKLTRLHAVSLVTQIFEDVNAGIARYMFQPNDDVLWATVSDQVGGYMERVAKKRGSIARDRTTKAPRYRVVCDASNNTGAAGTTRNTYVDIYLVPQDASEEQQITAVVLRDDAPMPEAA